MKSIYKYERKPWGPQTDIGIYKIFPDKIVYILLLNRKRVEFSIYFMWNHIKLIVVFCTFDYSVITLLGATFFQIS